MYYFLFLLVGITLIDIIFKPIFSAKSLIFPYAIHKFDICKTYPKIWNLLKKAYLIVFIISYSIILIKIYKKFHFKFSKNKKDDLINYEKSDEMSLIVGTNDNNEFVKISERGLYQNIFITGTIGSGKTSSAMYPFTNQLIEYKAVNWQC